MKKLLRPLLLAISFGVGFSAFGAMTIAPSCFQLDGQCSGGSSLACYQFDTICRN